MKYEKQTGTALPDSVLVATLLNKTSGALQTHLRLNARTLTSYEGVRTTILGYHQSRHIPTGASSSGKGKKGGKLGKGKGKSARMDFHRAAMAKGKGKDR